MSVATVPYRISTGPGVSEAVESRFALSQSLAQENMADVDEILSQIAATDFSVPTADLDAGVESPGLPELGETPQAPRPEGYTSGLSPVAMPDLGAWRAALNLEDLTLDPVDLPPLEAIAPVVNLPTVPDATLPEMPDAAPTVGEVDLAVVPTVTLPDAPTFEDLIFPVLPQVQEIAFEGTMPSMDLTPPDPMFLYSEETYRSDLKDALFAKLLHDVQYGGTGLDAQVEADIIARALDALDVELEKAMNTTQDLFGSLGHEFPPGALAANWRQDLAASNRERTNLMRDIAKMQAELAQKNTHFAIESGISLEKVAMDYVNQVAQRAFDAAKYTLQAAIDVFNARVLAFNGLLDAYKTQAQVFEARIRAELSKIELFRAQMEGVKVQADVQRTLVEIYAKRLDAVTTLIELYRAQLEGSKLRLEVDRTKIDAFRALVETKTAQIQGKVATFNLYQAQIAGEEAKVRIYGEQVAAYRTQVDATKVGADIERANLEAAIAANNNAIEVLKAAIEKYKADVVAETSMEEARVKAHGASVEMYKADVQAKQGHEANLIDRYKAQIAEIGNQIDLLIKSADVKARTASASKEIVAELLKAMAGIKAQLAASAMSAVSASAQMGISQNLSTGYNASLSNSYSESKSLTDA